jgi:hypothetical protein
MLSPKTLRAASCSHDQYVSIILEVEVLVLGVVLVQGAPTLSQRTAYWVRNHTCSIITKWICVMN